MSWGFALVLAGSRTIDPTSVDSFSTRLPNLPREKDPYSEIKLVISLTCVATFYQTKGLKAISPGGSCLFVFSPSAQEQGSEAGTEGGNGLARGCQGSGWGQVRAEHPYFCNMPSLVAWPCVSLQLSATFVTYTPGSAIAHEGFPVGSLSNADSCY